MNLLHYQPFLLLFRRSSNYNFNLIQILSLEKEKDKLLLFWLMSAADSFCLSPPLFQNSKTFKIINNNPFNRQYRMNDNLLGRIKNTRKLYKGKRIKTEK